MEETARSVNIVCIVYQSSARFTPDVPSIRRFLSH